MGELKNEHGFVLDAKIVEKILNLARDAATLETSPGIDRYTNEEQENYLDAIKHIENFFDKLVFRDDEMYENPPLIEALIIAMERKNRPKCGCSPDSSNQQIAEGC